MKTSQLIMPTLREDPGDAEIISHKLLVRAGMIRKTAGGIYVYLPMAYRVIKKIIDIVRQEMDRAGGQEVGLPIVQPRELWDQSGRWQVYGDEMFRLRDRHQREFCLGPTHEEVITYLVKNVVNSYRDLPVLLYQIQDKFRDEIRPRFGLMRAREFIMKDLYSFDIDETGLEISYQKMYSAYNRIFQRIGLDYRVVEADSGAIGGNSSHEYMVLAGSGESVIVFCDKCDFAANIEKAECKITDNMVPEDMGSLKEIQTTGVKTVEDVVKFLGTNSSKIIKTLIYLADGKPVAVLVRGDREVNEIKLSHVIGAREIVLAREEIVRDITGSETGSIGPVGLNIDIWADNDIKNLRNATAGANRDGYHIINVNPIRDFKPTAFVDIRNAQAGDLCPRCEGILKETRGIEVGHIFKLGKKYSESMNAQFLDEDGNQMNMIMGCYGIGISRTMAAAVEQRYDENGIIWPISIAPFQVIVVPVNINDSEQAKRAEEIYFALQKAGIDVLYDDRDERAGVKFKDADLIGIPIRITVGPRSLKEGKVELKVRGKNKDVDQVPLGDVVATVAGIISSEMNCQDGGAV
ncbi:MAG: proline--tRNA ligase [Chitinophagales bacterium]